MLDFNQSETQIKGKRIVFLVGAPRSGTTWLQLLLARSPEIATAQETHLYDLFLRSMIDQWERLEESGEKIGLNQILSRDEFSDLLRSISAIVFAKIIERKPEATVILEKTPNHVGCWREILEIWPNAHFIHIIRDPRSVVASMRVASRTWASHWASSRISVNCDRWVSDVKSGRQIASATPNYQEVKFSDLISDGPSTVMRLLAGVGIQADLNECQRYVDECSIDNLKAGNLSGAPFDVAKMHPESFRRGAIDSWRFELSAWETALVEHLTQPMMADLGFELTAPSMLASIRLGLRRVAQMAKRKARLHVQFSGLARE